MAEDGQFSSSQTGLLPNVSVLPTPLVIAEVPLSWAYLRYSGTSEFLFSHQPLRHRTRAMGNLRVVEASVEWLLTDSFVGCRPYPPSRGTIGRRRTGRRTSMRGGGADNGRSGIVGVLVGAGVVIIIVLLLLILWQLLLRPSTTEVTREQPNQQQQQSKQQQEKTK